MSHRQTGDMFGQPVSPRVVSLLLFHDEREAANRWLYHGLLLLPENDFGTVIRRLNETRDEHDYYSEAHFAGLTNAPGRKHGAKAAVACDWVRLSCEEFFEHTYFYLLGIDLRRIDWGRFGHGGGDATRAQAKETMFYRFLNTAPYSACRWFFPRYARVDLHVMFKDKGHDGNELLRRVPANLNQRSWGPSRFASTP